MTQVILHGKGEYHQVIYVNPAKPMSSPGYQCSCYDSLESSRCIH